MVYGVGWDDVGGFAFLMLRVGDSAYGFVELRTTVAAADYNGNAEMFSQGFKDLLAEVLKIWNQLFRNSVVDMQLVGCGGTSELAQFEMFGKFHIQNLIFSTQNTQNTQNRMMQMASDHL